MRIGVLTIALAAAWLASLSAPGLAAEPDDTALAEVRSAFALHGKPVPPEIFRDFGDGNLADSGSVWVTVDLEAAIDSNLYADPIRKDGGWLIQSKPNQSINGSEQTAYTFVSAADNGLLVVVASYSGGGSGTFYTLHILDVAAAGAFAEDGSLYRRINLTVLRSVALGDRWEGEVTVAHNSVRIRTTRKGPADSGPPTTRTVTAERP